MFDVDYATYDDAMHGKITSFSELLERKYQSNETPRFGVLISQPPGSSIISVLAGFNIPTKKY